MQTPPSALKSMMRGLGAAYTVVVIAYFPVASAGYAAFGNVVSPDVLLSVRKPAWLISIANFMVVIHLAASYQVQPPHPPLCMSCLPGKVKMGRIKCADPSRLLSLQLGTRSDLRAWTLA